MKILLSVLAVMPVILVARTVSLALLWRWFVVPLGVVPISPAHAFGLTVIVSFLQSGKKEEKSKPWKEEAFLTIATALLASGMGWVTLQVMEAGW